MSGGVDPAGDSGTAGPGPAPSPGAIRVPDRLPPEVVAEIRSVLLEARVSAEQRAASAGPLRDLAAALQQNAEALRAVQETQERIARTVDRTDRTEAVIQSTQALNETFRGVRTAQDALVQRLEKEERRPLRYGLAAALLVGGTAAAAGWLLLHREDDLRGRIEELRAGLGTADRESWEASRRAAEKELLDRVEALSRQTYLSEAERGAKERELLARRDELEALRRDGVAAAARRGALESEVERLRRENDALRGEAAAARRAAEEAGNRLREREAAGGAPVPGPGPASPGAPAASDPGAASPAPAAAAGTLSPSPSPSPSGKGTAAPPSSPPLLGPQAVPDRGQVRKVLDDLNALLAGVGGRDLYRVTEAAAVDGDRLVSAKIESRGPDGAVRRSFEAEEARFVLMAASRSLEIRLRSGSVTYLGKRTVRFLDDEHTAYLEVDPAPFRTSGNPVITLR
ncbi:MAG: hypothetical protein L6R43_12480 [Planctomycetes bacterium]|nr:hypothetical protein [Planctomycetota bacterium]